MNGPTLSSRKQLRRRIRKQPQNADLLACLSCAYFEEGAYAKALRAGSRAYSLSPGNPLVQWDYARALYMNERFGDAVMLYRRILKRKVATIARYMHWPDEKARQFQNTSRFDLALCYIQLDKLSLATEMLRSYISECRNGPFYYSPDLARAKLRSLERLSRQAKRRSKRLWISLLEIRKLSVGRRVKYRRGFTNGFVTARRRSDAIAKLRLGLAELGYELVAAEDTEEFDRRALKTELPDSTKHFAEQVRRGKVARFTDFCMYPSKR